MPDTDMLALATVLRSVAADLDGYIDRKATGLAAERVGAAEDAASDRVAAVVGDLNRRLDESQAARQLAEDLLQELRRRITPGVARDRLAAALGVHPYGYDLAAIVRDVEKALRPAARAGGRCPWLTPTS